MVIQCALMELADSKKQIVKNKNVDFLFHINAKMDFVLLVQSFVKKIMDAHSIKDTNAKMDIVLILKKSKSYKFILLSFY